MTRKEFLVKALNSINAKGIIQNTYEIIVIKNFLDETIDMSISKVAKMNIYSERSGLGQKIVEVIKVVNDNEMIVFLEDDDLFFDEKINRLLEVMDKTEDIYFYHNAFISVNERGNYLGVYKNHLKSSIVVNLASNFKQILYAALNGGAHNLSSMAVSSNLIKSYSELIESITYTLDHAFFLLSLDSGHSMYFDNTLLTKYTVHNGASRLNFLENDYLENKREFIRNAKSELVRVRSFLKNKSALNASDFFIWELGLHEWFLSSDGKNTISNRNLFAITMVAISHGRYLLFLLTCIVAIGKILRLNKIVRGKIYRLGASLV